MPLPLESRRDGTPRGLATSKISIRQRYQFAKLQDASIDAPPLCSLLCRVPLMTLTSRLRVSDDISKLVGETPMLQMKKLAPPGSADIFSKLEYLNPVGSVKDRAASGLIARAESEGKLKPGGTVIEATAGNTGIGLALIGVSRGSKVRLFVPEKFSAEKVIIIRALGPK